MWSRHVPRFVSLKYFFCQIQSWDLKYNTIKIHKHKVLWLKLMCQTKVYIPSTLNIDLWHTQLMIHSVWFATYDPTLLATSNYKHFANFVAITSGFLYTYMIMFTPQMFFESLWPCTPPPIVVSFLQWGVNFIKYVQRNPEVSSIKSFIGIQLQRILVIGGLPAIQGCM